MTEGEWLLSQNCWDFKGHNRGRGLSRCSVSPGSVFPQLEHQSANGKFSLFTHPFICCAEDRARLCGSHPLPEVSFHTISVCSLGWLQICNPPASDSQMLFFQVQICRTAEDTLRSLCLDSRFLTEKDGGDMAVE